MPAGLAAMAMAAFLWSTNIFFGKLLLEHLPPFTLSFLRQVVTLAATLPLLLWAMPGARRAAAGRWPLVTAVGLLGFAVPHTLIYLALLRTTAISVAILNSLVPALVVLVGVVAFGLRASPGLLLGVAISGAGAAVLVARGGAAGVVAEIGLGSGELIGLAAMAAAALYTALSGALLREVPGLALAAAGSAAGTLALAPLAAMELAAGAPVRLELPVMLGVVYVGVFPSAVAMMLWSAAIRRLGPERTSQGVHLIPVFTTILAVAALGERVAADQIAAAALIVLGLWLARRASPG